MANPTDLTGKRFGKLTALKRTNRKSTKRGFYWLCKCDCGGYKEVTVAHLNNGDTRSCGCLVGKGKPEHPNNPDKFSNWLSQEMVKKGLTNRKLAEISGIHETTIGTIRNHGRSVTENNVKTLRSVLETIPDFEYPPEVNDVPYKVVMDGKFRVYSNGVVYRKNSRGVIKEAPITYTGRKSNYATVSYTENGIQTNYYVHRLVGEAFIPNPYKKPEINHKDGNPMNNKVENLEWVTRKENTDHAYENDLVPTLDNSRKKCRKCKLTPVLRAIYCPDCRDGFKKLKKKLRKNQEARKKYGRINTQDLKDRYRRIIRSRYRGVTLEDISKVEGFSREYIRQLEKRVLAKDPKIYKETNPKKQKRKTIRRLKKTSYDKTLTIKEARKKVGLSQCEVASILGVSQAAVTSYERYQTIMTVDKALRFSEAIGVPFMNINFVSGVERSEQNAKAKDES